MKRIFIYGSLLLLLVMTLFSCNVVRVTADFSEKEVPKVEKIALVSTYIGKIQQPVLPLIDAGLFNKKTNEIADEIIDMQGRYVDKFRENIAANIEKYFNCEVIYGDKLTALDGFGALKENYSFPDNLYIENDHFPVMHIASGDINPFTFDDGKVLKYFDDFNNYKLTVFNMCKEMGWDFVAVSYSQLSILSVSAFGISGAIRLDSYIYVFDKFGDLIAKGKAYSKFTNIKGKELGDYESKIEDFSLISDPLSSKTAEKFVSSTTQ